MEKAPYPSLVGIDESEKFAVINGFQKLGPGRKEGCGFSEFRHPAILGRFPKEGGSPPQKLT